MGVRIWRYVTVPGEIRHNTSMAKKRVYGRSWRPGASEGHRAPRNVGYC